MLPAAKNAPRRRTVLASPHHDDVFLVTGPTDMRLYALGEGSDKAPGQPIDRAAARGVALLHVDTEANARCVAWCPSKLHPFLIAVGHNSGQVVLHDCTPATAASYGDERQVREFGGSKLNRPCTAVSWNKLLPNLVVAGLEHVRGQRSMLVWDVEQERAPVASYGGTGLGAGADIQSSASACGVGGACGGSCGGATITRAFSCQGGLSSSRELYGGAFGRGQCALHTADLPAFAGGSAFGRVAPQSQGRLGGMRANASDNFLPGMAGAMGGVAGAEGPCAFSAAQRGLFEPVSHAAGGGVGGLHLAGSSMAAGLAPASFGGAGGGYGCTSASALCATSFKLGKEAETTECVTRPAYERSDMEGVAAVTCAPLFPKKALPSKSPRDAPRPCACACACACARPCGRARLRRSLPPRRMALLLSPASQTFLCAPRGRPARGAYQLAAELCEGPARGHAAQVAAHLRPAAARLRVGDHRARVEQSGARAGLRPAPGLSVRDVFG